MDGGEIMRIPEAGEKVLVCMQNKLFKEEEILYCNSDGISCVLTGNHANLTTRTFKLSSNKNKRYLSNKTSGKHFMFKDEVDEKQNINIGDIFYVLPCGNTKSFKRAVVNEVLEESFIVELDGENIHYNIRTLSVIGVIYTYSRQQKGKILKLMKLYNFNETQSLNDELIRQNLIEDIEKSAKEGDLDSIEIPDLVKFMKLVDTFSS